MPSSHPLRDALVRILAAYPVVVAVLSVINLVAPQRAGPLGLSHVFAPHLLLPVLVLVPIAVVARSRAMRLGVIVALILGAARFGPGLVSVPAHTVAADETVIRVMSWNLEAGGPATSELIAQLRATDADIVTLQELTPDHAQAIRSDPAIADRFASIELVPREGVGGIGTLSRFVITETSDEINPVVQEVGLRVPGGGELVVVNAHPFPPHYRMWSRLPIPLAHDPTERDADILEIRDRIDEVLESDRRIVVLGDFNVTDREPAFDDLSRGLWDAHEEVGQGTGSTWRPSPIEFLPFGVLRIDYFLGGPGTRPLSIAQDCDPRRSDHCILTAPSRSVR